MLVNPDRSVTLLNGHDHLFGFASLDDLDRHDHTTVLEPGSTLFLYSDGLIERHDEDIDDGLDRLVDLLTSPDARSCDEIVDAADASLAPDSSDDVVAVAVRVRRGGSDCTDEVHPGTPGGVTGT